MNKFNKITIMLTIVFVTMNVYKDGQYQFSNTGDYAYFTSPSGVVTVKTKTEICQGFYNSLQAINQWDTNHNRTGSCY